MKIGDTVEDFELPGTDGAFRLASAAGKIVVLYFYPKDDTPGCTIEGKDFSALLDDFNAAGALVYGISKDGIRSHENFRAKFNYAHHLLADEAAALCECFGVIGEKSMFGKKYLGIVRGTFIIDDGGKLTHEWRDIKDVTGHAADVLEAVREISPATH